MKQVKNTVHVTRHEFLVSSASLAALACPMVGISEEIPRGIRVRFLGSGAAGWNPEWAKTKPNMRRQSSVLVENKVLIDFTPCSFDMLPDGCRPVALFQTHSHGDHYNPRAAVRSGVKRMYVHETWLDAARQEVAAAASALNLTAPEVIGLKFGVPVTECGVTFTSVPSIHSTSRVTDGVLERTSMYLVEKGPSRLLYATDTGGISGDAARMVGIDPHVNEQNFAGRYANNPFVHKPQAITALIMEATDGDLDEDFRLFVHSSVQAVSRIVNSMKKFGRYAPPEGQTALLTHLGLKYRDWAAERVNAELPATLRAAHDGLEVVLG